MYPNQKDQMPYKAFDSYCLRTPILPFQFFEELTARSSVSDDIFFEKLQNPFIQEALYLASPELYLQLQKWKTAEIKEQKKIKRLRYALLKYLSRMATRCTPFGLFAGCSTGVIAKTTALEPLSWDRYTKTTRWDMHFLALLAVHLVQQPSIKKQLHYYPNSTLYLIGDRYRYVEYYYEEKRRVHSLESVSHSSYLEALLNVANSGASIKTLTAVLTQKDIDRVEAEDFIKELIKNQILVSSIEPTLTGPDYLKQLFSKLKSFKGVEPELKLITKMLKAVKILDKAIGIPLTTYQKAEDLIVPLNLPFERKYLLQTDTFTNLKQNSLSSDLLISIKKGITFLNRISMPQKNHNLEKFKSAFLKRYEHQKIDLLNALDVETGVGYMQNPNSIDATPFLDDLILPYPKEDSNDSSFSWSSLQKLLHQKLTKCLKEGTDLIEITDTDIKDEKVTWSNSPDTLATLVEIIKEKEKEYVVMDFAGGSSAANLMARFCYGEEAMLKLAEEITQKEAKLNKEKLVAEIIHLPESRTGNVLRRPYLREYEIPCLGMSDLPLEKQIPLNDLQISIVDNQLKLFSKKHQKEVLPKLTNAHNYSANPLPAYHFLCDLQTQNKHSYGFGWGSFFDQYSHLPRVLYKNLILSKARWHVQKKTIAHLLGNSDKENLLMNAVGNWRTKGNIPQYVQLMDGDNTLTINFNNSTSVKMLLDTVKNRERFTLEEFLFSNDGFVKNREGHYSNQLLIAFYKDNPIKKAV